MFCNKIEIALSNFISFVFNISITDIEGADMKISPISINTNKCFGMGWTARADKDFNEIFDKIRDANKRNMYKSRKMSIGKMSDMMGNKTLDVEVDRDGYTKLIMTCSKCGLTESCNGFGMKKPEERFEHFIDLMLRHDECEHAKTNPDGSKYIEY